MADADSSLDAALSALGKPGLAEPAEHPTPDQLAAYCRGELTSEQSEAIAAHLAWCRDDASFVLAFQEISGLEPSEEEPAEALNAAWESFKQRQGSAFAGPSGPAPLPFIRTPQVTRRRWRMPGILAASLLLAVLGTGGIISTLARLHRSTEPQLNSQIVDLGATDEERAVGTEVKDIVLQSDEQSLTVILHPTRELNAKRFSVALLDKDGKEMWKGDVRPMDLGTFHVTFPRDSLSSTYYVLELRGREDGRSEVLDRFPMRVFLRSSGVSSP